MWWVVCLNELIMEMKLKHKFMLQIFIRQWIYTIRNECNCLRTYDNSKSGVLLNWHNIKENEGYITRILSPYLCKNVVLHCISINSFWHWHMYNKHICIWCICLIFHWFNGACRQGYKWWLTLIEWMINSCLTIKHFTF